MKVADYFKLEQRFKMLEKSEPRAARELLAQAQADVNARRAFYEFLATRKFNPTPNSMNLTTRYLGFKLRTPLVPSASPLSEKIDNIKRMEDAGASAVVFHSLFEEQIRRDHHDLRVLSRTGHGILRGIAELFSCSARVQGRAGSVPRAHRHRRKRRSISQSSGASTAARLAAGWLTRGRSSKRALTRSELNIYSIPSDPDIQRGRHRSALPQHSRGDQSAVKNPGGGEAQPVLHELRAIRAARRSRTAPMGWCYSIVFISRTLNSRRWKFHPTSCSARRWQCACRCAGSQCSTGALARAWRRRAEFIARPTR